MLNLKLVVDLQCDTNPKTTYPSPPFVSFSHANQILAITLHVTSPNFLPIRLLSTRNPHASTPLSISSLRGSSSPQLNIHSPFHLLFTHMSSSYQFDSQCIVHLLSVHKWNSPWPNFRSHVHLLFVHKSSSFQPNFHSSIRLLSMHESGSPQLDSYSPICLFLAHVSSSSQLNSCGPLYATGTWAWSFSICTNLLQVSKA